MHNAAWCTAFKRRLGVDSPGRAPVCCQLKIAGDTDPCGRTLDPNLRHPAICEKGGGRRRAHHECVTLTERRVKAAGAHILTEEVVPELYGRNEHGELSERIMGLVIQWPGRPRHLLDIVIRSPFAKDAASSGEAGKATVLAARDKAAKYGSSVWALAIEPGGRIGVEGQACLAALARDAAHFGGSQAGTGRRGRLNEAALRMVLEVAVAKCDALRALQALGAHGLVALGWATATAEARRADRVEGAAAGSAAGRRRIVGAPLGSHAHAPRGPRDHDRGATQ